MKIRNLKLLSMIGALFGLFHASYSAADEVVELNSGEERHDTTNGCTAKVVINKVGVPIVLEGSYALHFIAIHNVGSCNLKNVKLVDYLSDYMDYKASSAMPYSKPSGAGGEVKWKGPTFPAGASTVITVKTKILHDAPDFITNKACLSADVCSTGNCWKWCDSFTSRVYEHDRSLRSNENNLFESDPSFDGPDSPVVTE